MEPVVTLSHYETPVHLVEKYGSWRKSSAGYSNEGSNQRWCGNHEQVAKADCDLIIEFYTLKIKITVGRMYKIG